MAWLKSKNGGSTTWTNTDTHEQWHGYKSGGQKTWTSSKTHEQVHGWKSGGQKTWTSTTRDRSSSFRPWMDDEED